MQRVILLLLFSATVCSAAPKRVWIDTDPSAIPGGHEVDDALALLQAFGSPELSIRGVSIVFGNADLATTTRVGSQIVHEFGPQVLRVFPGASSAADLGRETEASRALAEALVHERLTILAIGPATNVATVVKNHPELAARIREIIAVAARRPSQHFISAPNQTSPFRDLNFESDAEAFRILLASKIPLTFTPWEISSKVWLSRVDIQELAEHQLKFASLLPAIDDWLDHWEKNFGSPGFNPFDTLAVGYMVDRSDLTCSLMNAAIEKGADDTSSLAPPPSKPYLIVRPPARGGRRVRYCYSAAPGFKKDFLRRIAAGSRAHEPTSLWRQPVPGEGLRQ